MSQTKPKLIVFDLDYTLWPIWSDPNLAPPFSKNKKGQVVDSRGEIMKPYPESSKVLQQLKHEGYTLAIASRTSDYEEAKQLLDLFDWDKYFTYMEIYPGSKTNHFYQIKKKSHVDYKDMLYFDDEHQNVLDMTRQGVVSILVRNGITRKVVEDGLKQYARERK